MKLTANFSINLPWQMLASHAKDDVIECQCIINGFDITILLQSDTSNGSKKKEEKYWTYVLAKSIIKVTRDESEFPPKVTPNNQGLLDYTIQSEYFDSRISEYGTAAREAMNRIIRYFKFQLNTPFIQEFPGGHQSFLSAEWTDERDQIIGKGSLEIVLGGVPGLWEELNAKKLSYNQVASLNKTIQNSLHPQLHEEMISDAQSAIFAKNLRRAILELAIACEIEIKRSFFSIDSPARAVFDYLEDKGKVQVSIPELLSRVAQEIFGSSFKIDHPTDFQNVEYLFRCRNKVAHRGVQSFRDNSGVKHIPCQQTVADWWHSVQDLLAWLSKARQNSEYKN